MAQGYWVHRPATRKFCDRGRHAFSAYLCSYIYAHPDQNSKHIICSRYLVRFLYDISFYGLKLYTGPIFEAINPNGIFDYVATWVLLLLVYVAGFISQSRGPCDRLCYGSRSLSRRASWSTVWVVIIFR